MRDVIGILLSIGCIFHCLGIAFLAPLLTELGLGFDEEWVHLGLLVFVSIYTALFLWPVCNNMIRAISGMGLIALYAAMLFHGNIFETIFTVSGSLLLMSSHILDLISFQKEEVLEAKY